MILADFLWEYHISKRIQEILINPNNTLKIILNIPRSIEYWDISNLHQFISDAHPNYEVQALHLKDITKWENSELKLILFYRDPIPSSLKSWIFQNKMFSYITVKEDHYLNRQELEYLINRIFGEINTKELRDLNWDDFCEQVKVKDLNKILQKLNSFYDYFDIYPGKYDLSSFSLNIVLSYLIQDRLPEFDYNYLNYFEQFFNISIDCNLENTNQILDLLKGFNRKIPNSKSFEAHIASKYLIIHKLAKIEIFENLQFKENEFVWNFQITYLWIYLKNQIKKKNYKWVNEVLWAIKNYKQKLTSDIHYFGRVPPNDYNYFFWYKLFIYSAFFEENADINEYRILNRALLNLNSRTRRISRKWDQDSSEDYDFIEIKEGTLATITMYIQNQGLNNEIIEFYKKIPNIAYKPDFKKKFLNISYKGLEFINVFPEVLLFQILPFNSYDELEGFFEYISSKDKISEILTLLLIFRYYTLIINEFDNEDLDEISNMKEEDFHDIYNNFLNLLSFRIFKILADDNDLLESYWNNDYLNKFWIYDYYLLKNTYKYFLTLKKFIEIKEEPSLMDFCEEDFYNFVIPSKVYTEFLLFKTDFFKLQDYFLQKVQNKNTILFVVDGLSYLLAMKVFKALSINFKELKLSNENIEIIPLKIKDLTKTDFQLSNIWRNFYSSEKKIIVCHDTNISNDSLFEKCSEINTYLKMTGRSETISIKYQRKIAEFFDSNNNYFVYISNKERENIQIYEESTIIEKYKTIFLEILKDIKEISANKSFSFYITSDHGSIFVKPDDILQLRTLHNLGLSRKGTSRAIFVENAEIDFGNSPIRSLLIENLLSANNNPKYSLLPGITLGGCERYEHTGLSLEESIVPWIKITLDEES